MAPSYDETYFVINGSGADGLGNLTPDGKRNNNPVGYNLGFRAGIGVSAICGSCVDIQSRWTHLYATSRIVVSNFDPIPQLWPAEIIPNQPNVPQPFSGTANSYIGLMFQKGECLLDENVWNLGCWHFGLRQGLEWSYIRYNEVIEYITNTTSQTNQFHGHTKGMGPQIGVTALWQPYSHRNCCLRNLNLKFLTTATLIAANSKAKIKTLNILGVTNKVTQSSFWKLVPEWHLGVGLNYFRCFKCFQTSLEIGYEATTYIRGISKLIFDEAASPGHSFNHYSDFYLHGLYLGFNLIF